MFRWNKIHSLNAMRLEDAQIIKHNSKRKPRVSSKATPSTARRSKQ